VGRDESNVDLVERCRAGDEGAWVALVTRYGARAFRLAYAALGDRGLAEDATQEGFIRAYRTIHRIRDESQFEPWVCRAVAWETRSRARLRRATRELPLEDLTPAQVPLTSHDPLATQVLVEALHELSPDERLPIVLRFYLDLTEVETARWLRRPVGTVKSRTARALRRLAASPLLAELAPDVNVSQRRRDEDLRRNYEPHATIG